MTYLNNFAVRDPGVSKSSVFGLSYNEPFSYTADKVDISSIFSGASASEVVSPSSPVMANTTSALMSGIKGKLSTFGNFMSTPNMVYSSISGMFNCLATLGGAMTARNIYDYYAQQENLLLQNAEIRAKRLKMKGDIELNNLRVAHRLNQGSQELAVAGAGGRLSGSFLDSLTSNHRYALLDERTSALNNMWAASEAKRAGFISAIETAGKAQTFAEKNRAKSLASLTAYATKIAEGWAKEKMSNNELNFLAEKEQLEKDEKRNLYNRTYGGNNTMYSGVPATKGDLDIYNLIKVNTDPFKINGYDPGSRIS